MVSRSILVTSGKPGKMHMILLQEPSHRIAIMVNLHCTPCASCHYLKFTYEMRKATWHPNPRRSHGRSQVAVRKARRRRWWFIKQEGPATAWAAVGGWWGLRWPISNWACSKGHSPCYRARGHGPKWPGLGGGGNPQLQSQAAARGALPRPHAAWWVGGCSSPTHGPEKIYIPRALGRGLYSAGYENFTNIIRLQEPEAECRALGVFCAEAAPPGACHKTPRCHLVER